MRDHFEQLWEQLPPVLTPPDLEARTRFLLAHVAPGDRVLDLGCGDGTFTRVLADHGADAVGIDVAEAALRRARAAHPGLDFRRGTIEAPLPLADHSFDAVWCSEVIEHVADTAQFMSEARRILRPRGRILLTTPYHGRLGDAARALGGNEGHYDPQGDHLRFYTRRSLTTLLDDFHYDEVTLATAGGAPFFRHVLLASGLRA